MAYIICEPCVDIMDTACVDVCPVFCIHTSEGETQSRFGASFYGWLPSLFATPLLKAMRSTITDDLAAPRVTNPGAVQTDGEIYSDDIKERYRRYGMVNRVSELADHYRIEIEFPRWVPNSAAKERHDSQRLLFSDYLSAN